MCIKVVCIIRLFIIFYIIIRVNLILGILLNCIEELSDLRKEKYIKK